MVKIFNKNNILEEKIKELEFKIQILEEKIEKLSCKNLCSKKNICSKNI